MPGQNLPEPPRNQPANRPWAVLWPVVLTGLALAGLWVAWSGLGPTGSVAVSSPPSAGDSSVRFPGSSVTFAQVATLIAMERATPGPALLVTMEAIPVYLAEVTPTAIPTPLPATATYEAVMKAARDANATATAAARPRSCYETLPGQDTVCFWPSPTATMPPPLPTLPPCGTPIPGELCLLYEPLARAAGTPLPVILRLTPGVPR